MIRKKLIATLLTATSIIGMSIPVQAAPEATIPTSEIEAEEDAANDEAEWYIISVPTDSNDMEDAIVIPVGEEGLQASLDIANTSLATASVSEGDEGISLLALQNVPGTWIQAADGRWWYQHTDGGYSTNAWELINGKWYYFDGQGWMHTGWLYYYDHWYYCDPATGAMMTGWFAVNGVSYFCNSDGWMLTGWINEGGWYYCDETSGAWVNNTGTQMIQEALKYIGTRYQYGGNSLTNGVDCSGYTQQIHYLFGISIPRTSASQYTGSHKISSPLPGDLAFFGKGSVSHVAFYMGRYLNSDNYLVHASSSKNEVRVDPLSYRSDFIGFGTYWR